MSARRIIYIQFTDPAAYPPLEHSSLLLKSRGWEIVFLGIRAKEHFRFPQVLHLSVHNMRIAGTKWGQKLQYFTFFLWTLGWTLLWRPRWIYASDPPSC